MLPIWVGPFEGMAIAMILEQVELPRPATYNFTASILGALAARLREVRITLLTDITYYAEAILEGPQGMATVDARPSDALALALLGDARITVRSTVLEGTAAWDEFMQVQDKYVASAQDIAEERKSAWERELEEFRAGGR